MCIVCIVCRLCARACPPMKFAVTSTTARSEDKTVGPGMATSGELEGELSNRLITAQPLQCGFDILGVDHPGADASSKVEVRCTSSDSGGSYDIGIVSEGCSDKSDSNHSLINISTSLGLPLPPPVPESTRLLSVSTLPLSPPRAPPPLRESRSSGGEV